MTTPTLPSWSSTAATWEEMRPVRLALLLGVLILVATGPNAFAGTDQIEGVSEERIYISLAIYVSSVITVGAACYILGRWTKGRESAQEQLVRGHAELLDKVTSLERQMQERPDE